MLGFVNLRLPLWLNALLHVILPLHVFILTVRLGLGVDEQLDLRLFGLG
jgi:hypothetical protein